MRLILLSLCCAAALSGAAIPMDSARGDRLFESQGCAQCHRLKGAGGTTASDLGKVLDRAYSPAELAAAMWNHAPVMWQTIRARNAKVGELDKQAAADLFASFYSARYFEMPGDAARGKALFTAKSCAGCHGLAASPDPQAKPIRQWQSLADPVALVSAMWNHSPAMSAQLSQAKKAWPHLNTQELSDLLVYLRSISSETLSYAGAFQITAGEGGARLFADKGCLACHKTGQPIAITSLTGVAAAMWNHGGLLYVQPPHLDAAEMREIVSYYWAQPFFAGTGNAARGRRIFAAKHCAGCHSASGPGPQLSSQAGSWNGITMVAALWRHGPAMLDEMAAKKIAWPRFGAGEMTDLIAWLNSPRGGGKHQ